MLNSNKKVTFKFFSVCEWKKEQEYLQNQHRKGWKLTKVGFCRYHFEKCEPEEVIYQLDFNAQDTLNKENYIQMFSDCGWEYLQDFVGYSYFRKPVSEMPNGKEEIFCDESSRIDMMKRVFKGRIVPLIIIFMSIIIPQLFIQSHTDEKLGKAIFIMYIVLAIIYLINFIHFGMQLRKYIKSSRQ